MSSEGNTGTTVLGENLETRESEQTATQTTDNTASESNQTSNTDYLSALVGEGKKYSTTEEAAIALAKKAVHADQFIETLKTEKHTLKTEKHALEGQISSAKKVEDILELLNKEADGISTISTVLEDIKPNTQENGDEDVKATVARILKEKEEEAATADKLKVIKENQEKSWDLLAESMGGDLDSAKLAIKDYIGEDTIRAEIINQLGSHKPEELVKFIKAQKSTTTPNTSTTTQRTVSEFEVSGNELTWSKAKTVKKENPKLYKSHKFQQLLHSAAATNNNFFNE
jgi:hypothetical protein